MFRCLQTKKAPPARLYCLIDGAKILTSNRSTPILHLYYMFSAFILQRVRSRYLLLNISSFFRFSSSKIRDCFSYATLLDIEFDRSLL